jgi:hypothetical protein
MRSSIVSAVVCALVLAGCGAAAHRPAPKAPTEITAAQAREVALMFAKVNQLASKVAKGEKVPGVAPTPQLKALLRRFEINLHRTEALQRSLKSAFRGVIKHPSPEELVVVEQPKRHS